VEHEIRTLAAAMENAIANTIDNAWPNIEPVQRARLISLVRSNVVFATTESGSGKTATAL
jgi:hypothetical protein